MARRYEALTRAQRANVDAEVDRRFYQKYATAPRNLNWNNPAHRPLAREWLRIRDEVVARRKSPKGSELSKLPQRMQPYEPELQQAMGDMQEKYWQEFENVVSRSAKLTSLFDLLEKAGKVSLMAKLWANMRSWGCSSYDIERGIEVIINDGRGEMPAVVKIVEAFTGRGRLTRILPYLGKAGFFATIIKAVISSLFGIRRGDYHLAAVEIYKATMTLGPELFWWAIVDSLQDIASAIWPGMDDHRFFRYLRCLNPIGLGGIAVDAFGTLMHTWVVSGADPRRLDRLIARMRESGAGAFVDAGEWLGDALFRLSRMNDLDFNNALNYSFNRRRI